MVWGTVGGGKIEALKVRRGEGVSDLLLVLHCMDGLGGWVCFVCEQCISLVRIDCIEPAKLDGRFGGGYSLVIRMRKKV